MTITEKTWKMFTSRLITVFYSSINGALFLMLLLCLCVFSFAVAMSSFHEILLLTRRAEKKSYSTTSFCAVICTTLWCIHVAMVTCKFSSLEKISNSNYISRVVFVKFEINFECQWHTHNQGSVIWCNENSIRVHHTIEVNKLDLKIFMHCTAISLFRHFRSYF